jgi:two-component system cell cycle response regulator
MLVARVRLLALLVILIIPLKSVLLSPHDSDNWVGLTVAVIALLLGTVILALARRLTPPRWLGLFSSLVDVSLVTAANVGFLVAGHPLTATNSQVHYSVYFLALFGACFRHDVRLCLAAGAAAVLQYGAVVLWAMTHWDLRGPAFQHDPYGAFNADSQVGRLLLLAVATGMSVFIVARSGRHWRESHYDRLTGLPNRRFVEDRIERAFVTARETARPLAVALADLDQFKQINDQYGHATGDAVLRHTAAALRQSFRRSDVIARFGGEEFVILLPDAATGAAAERLERFRRDFAAQPLRLPTGEVPVTVSLGLAVFPSDGADPATLLACADQRLYAAKQAGRNCLHGPPPATGV